MSHPTPHSSPGFIALISILVIGALTLLIAVGVSLRALNLGDRGFAESTSASALYLAESCAEYTLAALVLDGSYGGAEERFVGEETCRIGAVENPEASVFLFTAESAVGEFARRISVEAVITASSTQVVGWTLVPLAD